MSGTRWAMLRQLARTRAMSTSASSIPTLTQAYKSGKLTGSSSKAAFSPSSELNDRISLHQGDITKLEVDAIVNAANKSLLGGGGVDGAIHRAAGPDLVKECRTLNGADTGEAKITKGYRLPAKHVIHTVGPVYSKSSASRSAEQLKSCYHESLKVAVANGVRTIAFSGISTGVYGYPLDDATHVALRTSREFLESSSGSSIDRIIYTLFGEANLESYQRIVPTYFPPADSGDS